MSCSIWTISRHCGILFIRISRRSHCWHGLKWCWGVGTGVSVISILITKYCVHFNGYVRCWCFLWRLLVFGCWLFFWKLSKNHTTISEWDSKLRQQQEDATHLLVKAKRAPRETQFVIIIKVYFFTALRRLVNSCCVFVSFAKGSIPGLADYIIFRMHGYGCATLHLIPKDTTFSTQRGVMMTVWWRWILLLW